MLKSASISIIFALLIVFIVQYIETGSIAILFQLDAFLIVIGGTICATVINFRSRLVFDAIKSAFDVFKNTSQNTPNRQNYMYRRYKPRFFPFAALATTYIMPYSYYTPFFLF